MSLCLLIWQCMDYLAILKRAFPMWLQKNLLFDIFSNKQNLHIVNHDP